MSNQEINSSTNEPSQLPDGKHNELEKMSASDLTSVLKNMVQALHPDILMSRLISSLIEARLKLRKITTAVAHDDASEKNAASESHYNRQNQLYSQELQKVWALEYIVDLCLTEAKGLFVCRDHELNTLLRYAIAYINTSSSERRKHIIKELGALREGYERSIPYQIDKAAGDLHETHTPEELEKLFTLVYEENKSYLASVFPKELQFTWESFVSVMGSLAGAFFYAPGFVSRRSLMESVKDIEGFDQILRLLEYDSDRAKGRLELSPVIRTRMNNRFLLVHPIPSTKSSLIVSCGLLCDSLNWYTYSYRKKSGAFRKAKGHLFEDRIVQTLKAHSWKIVTQNLVLNEPIVPNESKAEYDIIAAKGRYMLIIEAKAYTPETRVSGYSEAKRLKLGTAFARKLRLKAEYIANNISEIPKLSADANCNIFIPVLLSTYPFVAQSVSEDVAVLTEPELSELLITPDSIANSAQIHLQEN